VAVAVGVPADGVVTKGGEGDGLGGRAGRGQCSEDVEPSSVGGGGLVVVGLDGLTGCDGHGRARGNGQDLVAAGSGGGADSEGEAAEGDSQGGGHRPAEVDLVDLVPGAVVAAQL